MGPLQVWPMVCGSRGSKNVTYRQQTTDKKVKECTIYTTYLEVKIFIKRINPDK